MLTEAFKMLNDNGGLSKVKDNSACQWKNSLDVNISVIWQQFSNNLWGVKVVLNFAYYPQIAK